ncbi:MAG: D-alanyl-D-alanine carboxypeptidase family protein [Fusobacteriaceae bacterium]|nr:D-alanyl-D-alanine carboxypeptidase family protein [Fusobacteriaceae bacterium]
MLKQDSKFWNYNGEGKSEEEKQAQEGQNTSNQTGTSAKGIAVVKDENVYGNGSKNPDANYLLEKTDDTKEKKMQRCLKAIGFDLNHKDCKECLAYGPNAKANNYSCSKKYKCIDGDIGVKSSSALIIFQSKCNPENPGAQKTGEPNIITGLADDTTIDSMLKYIKIKTDSSVEKRGVVGLSREELLKDWKPEKYEVISNEILPKELTVLLPKKALASPSLAVAWAQLIQGALDKKELNVNNLNFSGSISGFRSYSSKVKTYFEYAMNASYAAKPDFDFPSKVANEYEIYKKNPTDYDFTGKTKSGCVLSGKGKSNHGKCRAIDLVAGKKENFILKDLDCPNELKWLNDNVGKYGFSGYVSILKTSLNPLKDYDLKKGFYHKEVWHWDYLESYNTYTTNTGIKYTALDCFIKETREKLIKSGVK